MLKLNHESSVNPQASPRDSISNAQNIDHQQHLSVTSQNSSVSNKIITQPQKTSKQSSLLQTTSTANQQPPKHLAGVSSIEQNDAPEVSPTEKPTYLATVRVIPATSTVSTSPNLAKSRALGTSSYPIILVNPNTIRHMCKSKANQKSMPQVSVMNSVTMQQSSPLQSQNNLEQVDHFQSITKLAVGKNVSSFNLPKSCSVILTLPNVSQAKSCNVQHLTPGKEFSKQLDKDFAPGSHSKMLPKAPVKSHNLKSTMHIGSCYGDAAGIVDSKMIVSFV